MGEVVDWRCVESCQTVILYGCRILLLRLLLPRLRLPRCIVFSLSLFFFFLLLCIPHPRPLYLSAVRELAIGQ